MADSFVTLAELAVINDKNLADLEVSDLLNRAPMLARLFAQPSSNGESHKYTKETGAPVVGFRAANDGRENSKGSDELVTIGLKILDASFAVDVAVADAYAKGADAFIAREAKRHLRAAMFGAELQIINGKQVGGLDSGANAFAGFADVFQYKDGAMTVDAGGTTAGTASSVWMIRTLEEGVSAVGGDMRGNGMFTISLGDTVVQRVAGATGTYPAYYTPITAWLGIQIGGAYDLCRICNLTADAGKGLTDDLLYEAYSKFASGKKPNLVIASRRSLEQLRASRTATNPTGAPAPIPEFVCGNVPLVDTDALLDTEALLAATP